MQQTETTMSDMVRTAVRQWLASAVAAATPRVCLPPYLRHYQGKDVYVVSVGKAAPEMFAVAQSVATIRGGIIAGPRKPVLHAQGQTFQTGHPLPDANSLAAGQATVRLFANLTPADRVIVLISGGASASLVALVDGVSLADYRQQIQERMHGGADIDSINTYRRGVSRIKGGQLLRMCAAPVQTYAISDVASDDPRTIGGGPTYAEDADYTVVANNDTALEALADKVATCNLQAAVFAREVGDAYACGVRHAKWLLDNEQVQCVISGGEVTSRGGVGSGGPNHEYVLGVVSVLGNSDYVVAAIDSDGYDGQSGAAGALVSGRDVTLAHLQTRIDEARAAHNSAALIRSLGQQIVLGHTGTNINDLRLIARG